MKKILFIIVVTLVSVVATAAEKADTIPVLNNKITKVVEHQTTNSKGNPATKYYFVYDGELINTNKTTVEKYNLAKQYGAKTTLALIRKGKSKRIIIY